MRVLVRAKPGSRKESVTVAIDDQGSEVLVVRVRARAIEGAANAAVVMAVAKALGVRKSAVTVAVGERSRTKQLEVDGDETEIRTAVTALPREDAS